LCYDWIYIDSSFSSSSSIFFLSFSFAREPMI
jgi:hypothetical protein